jgi:hypothetical protein
VTVRMPAPAKAPVEGVASPKEPLLFGVPWHDNPGHSEIISFKIDLPGIR